jgi:hypothetical protein
VGVPSGGVSTEGVWKPAAGPLLLKKVNVPPEEKGLTNVMIMRILGPTNPYMWFIYPIIFFQAMDFFKLGPQ